MGGVGKEKRERGKRDRSGRERRMSVAMSMNVGNMRKQLGSKSAVARRPVVARARKSCAPRGRIAANRIIRCDWLSEHLNSGGFIGSRENIAVCTGTFIMLFAVGTDGRQAPRRTPSSRRDSTSRTLGVT